MTQHPSNHSTQNRVLALSRVLFETSRPDQILLIVGVYLFGITIAVGYGASVSTATILWGLIPLIPISASVHYANEFADYETDALTERTPFSGGSGALHREGFSRRVPLRAGIVSLAAGMVSTTFLFAAGLLPAESVTLLGVIAVLGWQYSVGPLKLAWRGWGELDNAFLGGLVLPVYGASIVGGRLYLVALACVPFFLFVLLNLFATQWPDRKADSQAGKRTLAVQWSPERLRKCYAGVAVLAGLSLLVLALTILPIEVAAASLLVAPLVGWGAYGYTKRHVPWPTVSAMLGLLIVQFAAWLRLVF